MDGAGIIQEVRKEELGIGDWTALTWAFMWRGICIMILSVIGGSIAAGILRAAVGVPMDLANVPPAVYLPPLRIFTNFGGLIASSLFIPLFIRWLLSARFGSFRLGLIKI